MKAKCIYFGVSPPGMPALQAGTRNSDPTTVMETAMNTQPKHTDNEEWNPKNPTQTEAYNLSTAYIESHS